MLHREEAAVWSGYENPLNSADLSPYRVLVGWLKRRGHFVLDVPADFSAAAKVRKDMYGAAVPQYASSIFGVHALARPEQLVEITFRAVIGRTAN